MNNNEITPTFTQKIGKTTNLVSVHFSETSSETFEDKIKRLILNDLANLEKNMQLMILVNALNFQVEIGSLSRLTAQTGTPKITPKNDRL